VPLKMTDMKLQDLNLTDRMAGHEIAGHEIARYARFFTTCINYSLQYGHWVLICHADIQTVIRIYN